MNPLLLHGPAVNNSRFNLSSLKQKFDTNNVVVFEEGSEIDEIVGSLMTQPIFAEDRLFILENPPEDFINYPLHPIPHTLILWFDHEVSEKKPILDWAKKNGQVMFFPEGKEVSIFHFLDYLSNGDNRAFLEIKKLKNGSLLTSRQGFDIFYLITMTFYLLRNLVATPKNAPEFVKQKLQRQRKNFDLEKITRLYKNLLIIDFKLKSGLLEQKQAEFLLVSKFTGLSY